MEIEIEAKFTDIDKDEMRTRLQEAGAVLMQPERLMRRHNFDQSNGEHAWVRVRDEGDKITMSYKRTLERTLHGMQEINLVVETVYQQHYDVTEEEIDGWPSITFTPVPDWLEKTRK